jgi:uncharacterized protein
VVSFLDVKFSRDEVIETRVPVAEFADGSPVSLPVVLIEGAHDGPTLFLQAGIHGDELTGIAVCQQVLADIDPAQLSGRVAAVPVVNLPAFLTRTRGWVNEERWLIDLNRSWPGTASGLMTHRIANVLFEQFIKEADFTIDLHSALDGCNIAPFVYVQPNSDANGTLAVRERHANAFGAPYVYYGGAAAQLGTSNMSQSLSFQADAAGIATMTAEMGESRRVTWEFVPIGVRGVKNVMKTMGMIEGEPEFGEAPRAFTGFDIVHVSRGGLLRIDVDLRDEVTAGQRLGAVVDVFGHTVEVLESPSDGFVLRTMRLGSVATGGEIFWIGH